ncbi:MAG: ABC transporter permease [Chloroflexi bacterium]|nr:ABC transporter permease [Chloroflexota bacterium]
MTAFLIKRIAQIVVTLFVFLTFVFFLIQAQPGKFTDPCKLNRNIPPSACEQFERSLGLDRPITVQYLLYVKNFFTGNLGFSFGQYPRPVTTIIKERLPRTLVLFVTATVLSFYLGFALGKIVAWRRGGVTEYAATLGGVTLYTVFTPWFALMMIWLFAFKLGWFPIGKFLDPVLWSDAPTSANSVFTRMLVTAAAISVTLLAGQLVASRTQFRWRRWIAPSAAAASLVVALIAWGVSGVGHLATDIVKHMALPVATLTLISFAGTMLLTRNSMLETMREDFVLAARAKGLPEHVVRDRHVARNALLPVVTSFVFSLAFAIDGGVIIETIFSWPGMGLTLVSAVQTEDLPMAVGAFVFTGVFALIAHLAADILHRVLDPRVAG